MQVKVNPVTGMVALVAGPDVFNIKEGAVFGALPKDAASILAKKHATLCEDLPEGSEDWDTVDINLEQGVAGDVEKAETADDSGAETTQTDDAETKPAGAATKRTTKRTTKRAPKAQKPTAK